MKAIREYALANNAKVGDKIGQFIVKKIDVSSSYVEFYTQAETDGVDLSARNLSAQNAAKLATIYPQPGDSVAPNSEVFIKTSDEGLLNFKNGTANPIVVPAGLTHAEIMAAGFSMLGMGMGAPMTSGYASLSEVKKALGDGIVTGLLDKEISAGVLVQASNLLGLPSPVAASTIAGFGPATVKGALGWLTAKDGANELGIYKANGTSWVLFYREDNSAFMLKADKADTSAISAGTSDKWVDAAQLKTALSAINVTGQYMGSSPTFAGLPTAGANNSDWALLTKDDGTNLRGAYIYNGTSYSFGIAIEDPTNMLLKSSVASTTDLTDGTAGKWVDAAGLKTKLDTVKAGVSTDVTNKLTTGADGKPTYSPSVSTDAGNLLEKGIDGNLFLDKNDVVLAANKASAADVLAGTAGKWADAANVKEVLDAVSAASTEAADNLKAEIDAVKATATANTDAAVKKADKADAAIIAAGTANKWVDAAGLKTVVDTINTTLDANADSLSTTLDGVVKKADKAAATDVTAGTADKWVDTALLKTVVGNATSSVGVSTDAGNKIIMGADNKPKYVPVVSADANNAATIGTDGNVLVTGVVRTTDVADAAAITAGTAGKLTDAAQLKAVADAASTAAGKSVQVSDKATAADLAAGTANKWVDAAEFKAAVGDSTGVATSTDLTAGTDGKLVDAADLKAGLDKKVNIADQAAASDITAGTAGKWVDAAQLKTVSGSIKAGVSTDSGNKLVAGADGKPSYAPAFSTDANNELKLGADGNLFADSSKIVHKADQADVVAIAAGTAGKWIDAAQLKTVADKKPTGTIIGRYAKRTNFPSTGLQVNDQAFLTADDGLFKRGLYAWSGTTWDFTGTSSVSIKDWTPGEVLESQAELRIIRIPGGVNPNIFPGTGNGWVIVRAIDWTLPLTCDPVTTPAEFEAAWGNLEMVGDGGDYSVGAGSLEFTSTKSVAISSTDISQVALYVSSTRAPQDLKLSWVAGYGTLFVNGVAQTLSGSTVIVPKVTRALIWHTIDPVTAKGNGYVETLDYVGTADKAATADITAGTAGKWIDAAQLKSASAALSGASADASNSLTVGSDGKLFYKNVPVITSTTYAGLGTGVTGQLGFLTAHDTGRSKGLYLFNGTSWVVATAFNWDQDTVMRVFDDPAFNIREFLDPVNGPHKLVVIGGARIMDGPPTGGMFVPTAMIAETAGTATDSVIIANVANSGWELDGQWVRVRTAGAWGSWIRPAAQTFSRWTAQGTNKLNLVAGQKVFMTPGVSTLVLPELKITDQPIEVFCSDWSSLTIELASGLTLEGSAPQKGAAWIRFVAGTSVKSIACDYTDSAWAKVGDIVTGVARGDDLDTIVQKIGAKITFDASPTVSSTKAVTSGGVAAALAGYLQVSNIATAADVSAGTTAGKVVDVVQLKGALDAFGKAMFLGSASTFAALPTSTASRPAAKAGDTALLTIATVGTGTAGSPQYPAGMYFYDGTKYSFGYAVASAQEGSLSDLSTGTSTIAMQYSPKVIHDFTAEASGTMHKKFMTGTFDFSKVHIANGGTPLRSFGVDPAVTSSNHAFNEGAVDDHVDVIGAYVGDSQNGTCHIIYVSGDREGYQARRVLAGGVWGSWSLLAEDSWNFVSGAVDAASGAYFAMADGTTVTLRTTRNPAGAIRLVPVGDWSKITVTTEAGFSIAGGLPQEGKEEVVLFRDPVLNVWYASRVGDTPSNIVYYTGTSISNPVRLQRAAIAINTDADRITHHWDIATQKWHPIRVDGWEYSTNGMIVQQNQRVIVQDGHVVQLNRDPVYSRGDAIRIAPLNDWSKATLSLQDGWTFDSPLPVDGVLEMVFVPHPTINQWIVIGLVQHTVADKLKARQSVPVFSTWPTDTELRESAVTGYGFGAFVFIGSDGHTVGLYLNQNAGNAATIPISQPVLL